MKPSDPVAAPKFVVHSYPGRAERSRPDGQPSASGGSRHSEPLEGRLRRLEPIAPAVIFALIAVAIGADLADDLARNENPGHLAGMAIGTLLSLTGLALMLRMLRAARARSQELEVALDHTRADSVRWREQTGQILQGVGALIDRQFAEWGLSPSEREIALLLLKGLSLKSIAEARDASEPTVRQQAQSIYRKGRLSGRAELSAFFLEDLLVPQTPGATETPPPVATGKARRA